MEQPEKDALNYRFSGYQLPMLQLDETGPAYACVEPHPYLYNQPMFWTQPSYPVSRRSRQIWANTMYPIKSGTGNT
jgi:hypothetical protein